MNLNYHTVTVEEFWQLVESGRTELMGRVFLLTVDSDDDVRQDFGYAMLHEGRGFFDHHRQGGSFHNTITHVVIPSIL